MWNDATALRCLGLLAEAGELLDALEEHALAAHLSLVMERLRERIPPSIDGAAS